MEYINFIHHWSTKTGCSCDESVLYAQSIIKWIANKLIDNGQLCIAGFGKFYVRKHLEYVEKDKKSNKRILYPPKLTVEFVPASLMEETAQENGMFNKLTDMLVGNNHVAHNIAEKLPVSFFKSILEIMDDEENVDVKGLGGFILTKVKIGDAVYGKIAFIPDESLSSVINRPFSFFSPVELVEGVRFDDLEENRVTTSEKEDQDRVFLISQEGSTDIPENIISHKEDNPVLSVEEDNKNESVLTNKPIELELEDTGVSNHMMGDDKGSRISNRLFLALVVFTIASALFVWHYVKTDNDIQSDTKDNIAYKDTFIERTNKEDSVSKLKDVGKETTVSTSLDYAAMNAQIPYGGYDIVGVESVIEVVPGMTLQKIAQIYLGTEHTVYLEVLNEGKTPQSGSTYKIPKLKLRKK